MTVSKRLIVTLVVCAFAGLCVLGCNTFKGAGKDIEKSGKGIQNAAENAEHPGPHAIAASAETGGTISPSGSTSVAHHSNRTFTITAKRGYHVADVMVDGKSVGARNRYTFENVTGSHTISAVFTANSGR
jgi:predicted small secreted protein